MSEPEAHSSHATPPLCKECGKPKKFTGTGKNAAWRCRVCSEKKSTKKKFIVKSRIVEELGGCCNRCGYSKYQSAMEFHHIDKDAKDFTISDKRRVVLTEQVVMELDKCILVCSNCHSKIHTENWQDPEYQAGLFALKREAIARSKTWIGRIKKFFKGAPR